MKTLTLLQGSPEWLAHRNTTRNASDAPAMMGVSPYLSRSDLIRRCATGVVPEIDPSTQVRFDRGHEVEPALRALAEKIIGEDLYPVTGVADDGYLGASFDGVTLTEDVIFEAKQSNAEKRACVERNEIPPQDYWQIVQQFAVCESAKSCLYMVGDGSSAGTSRMYVDRVDIADDIPKLRAGWAQFDADVAAYVPETAAAPAAVGRAPDQLPALHIELTGIVTASNLAQWKEAAIAVFQGIATDLQTDQDFADAERTVKWCGDIEDQLKAAKAHALGQTASIDELFRTIDAISAEARAKRLELDKLVKNRKEAIRGEIVTAGVNAVREHFAAINGNLGQYRFDPPQSLSLDIGAAIKGKKSIASMRDAVDAAAASAKVAASQRAERIRANVAILDQHAEHRHLFADAVQLAHNKAPEDLVNLIASRVREHQEREEARLERERERIRQEEVARIERERKAAEAVPAQQNSTAGAPAAQQPLDGSANNAGVATGSRNDLTSESVTRGSLPPTITERTATALTAYVKLGDINAAIAPLSISADGLATLGFHPAGNRGAAKLYVGSDLTAVLAALTRVIAQAPARIAAMPIAA